MIPILPKDHSSEKLSPILHKMLEICEEAGLSLHETAIAATDFKDLVDSQIYYANKLIGFRIIEEVEQD